MKHILFKLSMPKNNSWNGRWTGEDSCYCRVRSYPFRKDSKKVNQALKNVLSTSNYIYDFGDGWIAQIDVQECTAAEKANCIRKSQGFCGYEWMIDEIERFGRILTLREHQDQHYNYF